MSKFIAMCILCTYTHVHIYIQYEHCIAIMPGLCKIFNRDPAGPGKIGILLFNNKRCDNFM